MNDPRAFVDRLAGLMVTIPGGEVVLRDEATRRSWPVTLQSFSLARYPVPRELYASVVPASGVGHDLQVPVTDVSWIEAIGFCNLLSEECGRRPCYSSVDDTDGTSVVCDFAGDGFRLPTEAEWEHACRAGSSGIRYGDLEEIAWYRGNSGGTIHQAGKKEPNGLGLYDTIGNAWEWCWDVFDPVVYGPYRVFRGGGFADPPEACRASCRRKSHPRFRAEDVGFRLATTLQPATGAIDDRSVLADAVP